MPLFFLRHNTKNGTPVFVSNLQIHFLLGNNFLQWLTIVRLWTKITIGVVIGCENTVSFRILSHDVPLFGFFGCKP